MTRTHKLDNELEYVIARCYRDDEPHGWLSNNHYEFGRLEDAEQLTLGEASLTMLLLKEATRITNDIMKYMCIEVDSYQYKKYAEAEYND